MATTQHFYDGTGNRTTFPFTFEFMKQSEIKVKVDSVLKTQLTHYNIVNTDVVFTSGNLPPSGSNNVHIYRDTDVETGAVVYAAGSSVKAADLNKNQKQLLHAVQELELVSPNSSGLVLSTGTKNDIRVNSAGNWEIVDNSIDEAKLQIHNTPATGKILKYTSNGLEWVDEAQTIPTQITVADESSDTQCFPLFTTDATGNKEPKTGSNLTFNSATGALTATSFSGPITGNVTGNVNGNVTGDITGNVTGNITGDILGTSSIASTVTAITQTASDSSTKIATTAFVKSNLGDTEKPSGLKLGSFRPNTATLNLYSDPKPHTVTKATNAVLSVADCGVGNSQTSTVSGQSQGNYISSNGKTYAWGHEAADNDGSSAKGYADDSSHLPSPIQCQLRLPAYFMRALGGDSNEAQWLTDLEGNNLGYTNLSQPKVINMYNSRALRYWLTENGILFGAGNDTYSVQGNGKTAINKYAAVPVQFYDTAGNALTGQNRPKIKMFTTSAAGDDVLNSTQYNNIALDTNGNLYSWGHNNHGQLGRGFNDGGTGATVRTKACKVNFTFNGTPIYITSEGAGDSSSYCITNTGKLYAWGYNNRGQLGLGTTNNTNVPTEVTAVPSDLKTAVDAGAKVVHVYAMGGNTTTRRALVLTDAGKVYACGRNEQYGVYLGVHSSTATTDLTTFTEVTLLTTAMNAANEKAISLWSTGGDIPTNYVITDGGDTTNYRVFSWGNNSHGQLGRDVQTAVPSDATGLGVWAPAEILFQNYGDMEQMTLGNTPVNETTGTMSAITAAGKHKFGRPLAIASNRYASTDACQVLLLDDLGQIYICGDNGGYAMNPYAEYDQDVDRDGSTHISQMFTPVWSQPEPFIAFQFMHTGATTTNSWCALGASGTVYTGGYGASAALGLGVFTSSSAGAVWESLGGFHPLAIST